MAITLQDNLADASPGAHTLLDNHLTAIPGTAWVPLTAESTGKAQFTNDGLRVRANSTAIRARYKDPGVPSDGQVNIQGVIHGGNVLDSGALAGAIALAVGDGSDPSCYQINYSVGALGWQVNKVPNTGIPDAKLNSYIAPGSTLSVGQDQTILIKVRKKKDNGNNDRPNFEIVLNGSSVYNQMDTATAWPGAGAKRTGVVVYDPTSVADDTHGVQLKGPWTVTDFVAIVASPLTLTNNTAGQQIALTGMDTTWNSGTVFSYSGAAGSGNITQTGKVVTSTTSVTLTLTVGATTGTLTISDDASPANTVSVTVQSSAAASTALTLSGPTTGLTGRASGVFTVGVLPGGSAPASNTEVTLGDTSAGGSWTPPVVVLGPNVHSATSVYTAPANPGGTPQVTRAFTATATAGVTSLTAVTNTQYVAITPAVAYTVGVPANFTAGTPSAPLTIALPAGQGVAAPVAVILQSTPDGIFSPDAGSLTTASPSFQTVYTAPQGVSSVVVSSTNNGGLADPTGQTVAVSSAASYQITGDTNGPLNTTSYPFTVAARATTPQGDTAVTLSDGGVQGTGGVLGHFSVNPVHLTHDAGNPGADIQSAQTVYTPPVGYTGTVSITGTNNRGLINPTSPWPYVVYNPTTHAPRDFLAPYGPQATGQAAALGLTVYDPGGQVLLTHTASFTVEDGATGVYRQSRVLALADHGEGIWDVPAGFPEPGYTETYDALTPIAGVLAQVDKDAILGILANLWVPPTDVTQGTKRQDITHMIAAIYQALHGASALSAQIPAVGTTPAVPGTLTRKNGAGVTYNTQSVLDDGTTVTVGAVS